MIINKKESIIPIDDNFYKTWWTKRHTGGCQCSGDCDCYKRKGEIVDNYFQSHHKLSKSGFKTLEKCVKDFNKLKQLKNEKNKN